MNQETPNTLVLKEQEKQEIAEQVLHSPELLERIIQSPEFSSMLSVVVQRTHSGPLPAPVDMKAYGEIIPNGADRIMQMAEKEQNNSHELQHRQLTQRDEELKITKRGQNVSTFALLLFATLAAYLAYLGDTTAAAWVMGADLAAIIIALIYGNSQKNKKN